MSAASPTPPDDLSDALAAAGEPRRRAALARQMVVLGRLAEIALEAAEVIGRKVKTLDGEPDVAAADGEGAPEAPGRAPEPVADTASGALADAPADTPIQPRRATLDHLALSLDRVSRSLRLSYILQARVIEELRRCDRIAEGRAAEAVAQQRAELAARDHARKAGIQTIVTRIAEVEHPGEAERVDGLVTAACLQLRDRERFGDLLSRPVSEVIGLICRDLGLDPDWSRLADEAWARQEIAAGEVGAPLARFLADPDRFRRARKRRPPRPPQAKPPSPTSRRAAEPPPRRTPEPTPQRTSKPPVEPTADPRPEPSPATWTDRPFETGPPRPSVGEPDLLPPELGDPEPAFLEQAPDPTPAPSPPPFVPEQPWLAPSWSPHPQTWGGEPIYLPGEGPPPRRPRLRR